MHERLLKNRPELEQFETANRKVDDKRDWDSIKLQQKLAMASLIENECTESRITSEVQSWDIFQNPQFVKLAWLKELLDDLKKDEAKEKELVKSESLRLS